MPFFQNPFSREFIAPWLLGDRKYIIDFKCPPNSGRGKDHVIAYGTAPFDLSGNDLDGQAKNVLTIIFCPDNTKNWTNIAVTITAYSLSSVSIHEIVSSLNADQLFANYFSAFVQNGKLSITSKREGIINFYVKNAQAESVLKFNKMAGVSEIPTFFAKHAIENCHLSDENLGLLILLHPDTSDEDAAIIDNAVDFKGNLIGFNSSDVKEDWELLNGRCGLFTFKKMTVDLSDRVTEVIEYSAGSVAGDLSKKTTYSYTSSNKNPDKIVEIPYTLQSGDLVTP